MSLDAQLCLQKVDELGALMLCENAPPVAGHPPIAPGELLDFLQLYAQPELLKQVEQRAVQFVLNGGSGRNYKVTLSRSARGYAAYLRKFWGASLPALTAWQPPQAVQELLHAERGLILFAEKPHRHSGVLAAAFVKAFAQGKKLHIKNLSFAADLPPVLPGSFITAAGEQALQPSVQPALQPGADLYFSGDILPQQLPQILEYAQTGALVVAAMGAHSAKGALQLIKYQLQNSAPHQLSSLRSRIAAVVHSQEAPAGSAEPYIWDVNIFKPSP